MPGSYAETKVRMEQALRQIHDCEKPNIAVMAREFQVPATRLRARWNERPSKQDRPGPNKKLTDDQGLEVCLYLRHLDAIGTSAHTLRSLKRYAEFLETADLSPIGKGLEESIRKFAKGSLAQAEVGVVVQEKLSKTKAAELVLANGQNRSRHSAQKGGILYAGGARTMVRRRQRTMQKQR